MTKPKKASLSDSLKKVSEWVSLFEKGKLKAKLTALYGQEEELLQERTDAFLKVLGKFNQQYGNENVGFIRTPGRLNLLAMHVDHRGSFINPIAIQKEVILCFTPLEDEGIEIHNVDAQFGVRQFSINEEKIPPEVKTEEAWLDYTQTLTNERIQKGTNTDWVNKIKATPLYLKSMLYPQKRFKGLRGVLFSTIPPRRGLSSSSSLVVAMMDAMVHINNLAVADSDFSYHCGVAEWYVGTRGGFGDHAAMKFGRPGMITHMKTYPTFYIDSYIPFPQGYSIVIFDSGQEADKTGTVGQKFNEMTATYGIGELFIKKYIQEEYPAVYKKIKKRFCLADVVDCFTDAEIYGILQSIPESLNREQLLEALPEERDTLGKFFATHQRPKGDYRPKACIIYGVSECARGKIIKDYLSRKDIKKFGELMNVSHNGDRVTGISPETQAIKDGVKEGLPIYLHSGGYNCSIPEIDEMADIALQHGALGAQISGAGLGGSIMVLIKDEKSDALIEGMIKGYYQPRKIGPNHIRVRPIAGSGVF